MNNFLVATHNYTSFCLALFKNATLIDKKLESNKKTSEQLIPLINSLLTENNIAITDIQFIAVNCGPGPFTTLRSILSTANGIGFATDIPLVSIDGIHTLINEQSSPLFPHTVALFNAFNKDVYFGIQTPNEPLQTGYKHYQQLFEQLKNDYPEQTIRFIGSGASLYHNEILEAFGSWATIPEPLPEEASITYIGKTSLDQWNNKINISTQLKPLYLKKLIYHTP